MRLRPIRGYMPLARDRAYPVLTAYHMGQDDLRFTPVNRLQDLRFLVAHGVSLERHRRLHRGQREQLKHVVRHHVPESIGVVVLLAPYPDPKTLRDNDLLMIHVSAVPDRLEDPVSEPKDQDVWDRVLLEIVIDPADLVLVQAFEKPRL